MASGARAAALALIFATGCALAQNAVLLVAKPGMQDQNFRETVVLVTHIRRPVQDHYGLAALTPPLACRKP